MQFGYVTGGVTAEALYREYSGGNPGPFQSMAEYQSAIDPSNKAYGWAADNTAGERVEFKARWWSAGEEENSEFSDLLNMPVMVIDNTQPSALVLSHDLDGSDLTLSVGTEEMRVVQIRIERIGVGTVATWDARPGIVYGHEITLGGGTHEFRAYAKTSDGTESPMSNIVSVSV